MGMYFHMQCCYVHGLSEEESKFYIITFHFKQTHRMKVIRRYWVDRYQYDFTVVISIHGSSIFSPSRCVRIPHAVLTPVSMHQQAVRDILIEQNVKNKWFLNLRRSRFPTVDLSRQFQEALKNKWESKHRIMPPYFAELQQKWRNMNYKVISGNRALENDFEESVNIPYLDVLCFRWRLEVNENRGKANIVHNWPTVVIMELRNSEHHLL